MGGCAALSLILPNALTVLAVIPVLELVLGNTDGRPNADPRLTTALVLAVIYGANIGGTGSVTGSPANLYLLLALEVLELPRREAVHFFSWLAFGLPLMVLLLLPAWGILWAFTPRDVLNALGQVTVSAPVKSPPIGLQRIGNRVLAICLTAHLCVLLAAPFIQQYPVCKLDLDRVRLTVSFADLSVAAITVVTAAVLLSIRVTVPRSGDSGAANIRMALLPIRNLWGQLPWRGLLMAAGALTIVFAVACLGGRRVLTHIATQWLPARHGGLLLGLTLVILCIFATELLSNTTTATLLFPLAAVLSQGAGVAPLSITIGISLASTCAFMTPIATPVNALAFGALPGTRLRVMLSAGAVVNLVCGGVIALWVVYVVPIVLAWF
jgi:sodium-dependent dicarboxylate transporter 2/3/5